jgi:parvulin-like peptidyl-prolyl isomerase
LSGSLIASIVRSLRLFTLSLLGAALVVLGAACGGGDSTEPSASTNPNVQVPAGAVAVIDGTAIAKTDYDRLFAQAEKAYEAQGRTFPQTGSAEYEQLKGQTVQFLIDRQIREKKAAALGLKVTDQEVTDQLNNLKQQYFNGDEKKYQDELKAQGVTEEDVLADIRAQLISQKIYDQINEGVTVTDAEVQQYYDDNKTQFTAPESREVAHILVGPKDKALAEDIYQQLQNGADFAELAKKYSTDTQSAKDGGKLNDVRGTFVPEFEDVAFSLETGEISKPVKSQYGWHIITALEDTKPESTTPFSEVKTSLHDQLLKQKKDERMLDWERDARAEFADLIGYAVGFAPATTPSLPDLTESGVSDSGAADTGTADTSP